MNRKHFKKTRWGGFLFAALLLALCFALSGCNYEDLFPTHVHNFVRLGIIYGEAVYEDGVITDVKRVPCGHSRTIYEYNVCSICGKPLYIPIGDGHQQPHDTAGRYKVTTEPTCTKAGVETATCFYCHKVFTKSISALGHDYKNVAAKDPTCTEPGNTAGKKCKRCGHMHSGEELPALGHIWSEPTYSWSADLSACTASRVCARGHVETETAKAAVKTTGNTCEGGVTTYTATFTNPGFVAQSDTVAFEGVGHSEEIIPGVPATCAKTGLTEGKVCSVCGTILEERQKLLKDPNNHEGPFVLPRNAADVPSTCTTPGYHTEGICKACGVEVRTELPLDSDNHGEAVVLPAVPATCVSTGLTEGTKCAACGKVLSGLTETPVDPDNHDWDEANYNWQDSGFCCTAVRKCKLDCTHVQIITLPINVLSNSATCEQAGTVTYAADFGEPFAPQTKTSNARALGHDWGEWVITTEPTCTETGVSTRTCKREGCGKTETMDTPAQGHTGGTATCTEQAVCTRCNQPYGEALGHDWGAATYTWSADHSTCTAERECGRCHKGENATADALAGGTPATCTQAGKTTYTAAFKAPFATQTETVDVPALGHDWGAWGNSTATCTAAGTETRTCQRDGCGATETREVAINPNKHAGGTKNVYYEETKEGNKYHIVCLGCGNTIGEDITKYEDMPEEYEWEDDGANEGGETIGTGDN